MTYRAFFPVALVALAAGCGGVIITGGTGGSGASTGTDPGTTWDPGPTSTWDPPTGTTGGTAGAGGSGGVGGTGGVATGGSGGSVDAQPPDPGPPNPGDAAVGSAFAVSRLFLGDTDPDGSPNQVSGWKYFGLDLDGVMSTGSGAGLCKPRNGASATMVHNDGKGGRDNAFGKMILPIFIGLSSDFSVQVNDALASGGPTMLFDLEALGQGGSYNPLVGLAFQGADLGQAPKWNGTDVWPIAPESLNDPQNLATAKILSTQTYVVGNTWVAHFQGTMPLQLTVSGAMRLVLPIRDPVIVMPMDPQHMAGTNGTIAGVIPTEAFALEIQKLAGQVDPSLCGGPTLQSIVAQITQASDILADGTQDPTKECDGISIGLGFDARRVQLGLVAPPSPPSPDPCQ